jgi:hypothetical protein
LALFRRYGIGGVFNACPAYLVIGGTYPCHEDLSACLFLGGRGGELVIVGSAGSH